MRPLRATLNALITSKSAGFRRYITIQHEPQTDLLVLDLGDDRAGVPTLYGIPVRLIDAGAHGSASDSQVAVIRDRDTLTFRFTDGVSVEVNRTDVITFVGDLRSGGYDWFLAEAQFGRAA